MKISLPIQLQRDGAARKDPGLASDCELAARIREGDREALRRLVERHIGRLHSYLLHRLGEGNDDLIDKVVAATFSDALRRLTPYAKGTATTPMNLWLIRLAERNLARTRSASPSATDGPPSDLTCLRAAMSALPNRHKFVLSLAVFEQMPPGDIAAALGTTPSGAMRRLRAALKRVGQVLARQERRTTSVDSLRRMRPRITSSAGAPRRIRMDDLEEHTLRLRGANRRLASSLDQLRSGVPLNWGQVEDDPEMATLARLQLAGQECRAIPLHEPSPEIKAALIEHLATRLPAPRAKQEKAAPKSLAGFSENVQVLTQVEDNISLGINWPLTILRGLAGLAVVVLVIWGIASFLKANSTPSFSWIQALRGGQPASHMAHTFAQSSPLPCQVARMDNPTRPGFYIPVQSLRDAQANVDYNIPLLPESITVPTTYTFQLILASVDPCDGNTLKGSDPAALIALQYEVRRLADDPNATPTPNGLGRPGGIRATVATVVVFSSHEQPAYIDVTSGSWNEVTIGDLHGVHWRGNPYRDPSGAQWNGDVNVLVVEHEDTVVTMVGSNIDGITEQMLMEVARNILW